MIGQKDYDEFHSLIMKFILVQKELIKTKVECPYTGNYYVVDADKIDEAMFIFKNEFLEVGGKFAHHLKTKSTNKKVILDALEIMLKIDHETVYDYSEHDHSWKFGK